MAVAGAFTPMQIIASVGMLANTALAVPSNLTNAVTSYNSVPAIDSLLSTLDLAVSFGLDAAVITTLQTLGASSCPALGASIPTAYANSVTPVQTAATIPTFTDGGFAEFVLDTGNKYLGSGDLTKFISVYSAVVGYQTQLAQFIYSTVNADQTSTTFTNTTDSITGGISQVTLAFPAFAADLEKIGQVINLAKLQEIGTPSGLLQQISIAADIARGTLPVLAVALGKQGLTEEEIIELCTPAQSTLDLSRVGFNSLQKRAMPALDSITGTDLIDILAILDTALPNIQKLSDLLNPVKLFPSSWPSLTVATPGGAALIFTSNGATNPDIETTVQSVVVNASVTGCDELGKIVPPDQAVAAIAVGSSLAQINNIANLDPASLARAVASLDTLKGLDQIESLTQPVPGATNTYVQDNIATGSGPFGVLTVTDFLGISCGVDVVDYLNQATSGLSEMDLTTLKAVYDNMLSCVQGTFGPVGGPIVIPSGPAAGAYADADDAFTTGLIPAANTEIAALISAYPEITDVLNENFDGACERILYEAENQADAGIDYDELTSPGRTAIYSFVSGLSTVAAYNTPGGQAEYLILIANIANIGGQAVVGCIREGNNLIALNEAGIPVSSFDISAAYPGVPTTSGVVLAVTTVTAPTADTSALGEPAAEPAPVEYQTTTNPTSTEYTVDEARDQVSGTTPTPVLTAPSVVSIDNVYEQNATSQQPGPESATLLQGISFWIRLKVYPSDATTEVSVTTTAGTYTTRPGITLNSATGALLQLPGWLIPDVEQVTLTVSANQPTGLSTSANTLLDVVATNYPNSTQITQDGWFEGSTETAFGSRVTVTFRGPPSTAFTWGVNWTSLWPVGNDTFDSDGYSIYSALPSPPVSNNNQIWIRYASGETVTTTFKTVLA